MPPIVSPMMAKMPVARSVAANRSRSGKDGPGGPSAGLSRTRIAIVTRKSPVSISPGSTPAMKSRPIDCSVRIA